MHLQQFLFILFNIDDSAAFFTHGGAIGDDDTAFTAKDYFIALADAFIGFKAFAVIDIDQPVLNRVAGGGAGDGKAVFHNAVEPHGGDSEAALLGGIDGAESAYLVRLRGACGEGASPCPAEVIGDERRHFAEHGDEAAVIRHADIARHFTLYPERHQRPEIVAVAERRREFILCHSQHGYRVGVGVALKIFGELLRAPRLDIRRQQHGCGALRVGESAVKYAFHIRVRQAHILHQRALVHIEKVAVGYHGIIAAKASLILEPCEQQLVIGLWLIHSATSEILRLGASL